MKTLKWWQEAIFYQIYPRSFADSNGDGIGDLKGITGKLDYIKDLGADAIWLSPHFPSPQYDCGYDIADYTGVDPEYGTLDDFKHFLEESHRRDLRVILDLVLNHTSDQHPWFIESSSSRDNPRRDWYIWRDGKNSGAPNNWYSTFGGPAWEYDENTGQYYYHLFFKQQPDLNWRNPEVKAAMFDAVRFWLDQGVDGYRLDAIGTLFEDESLRDHRSELTQADLYRLSRRIGTHMESQVVMQHWTAMYQYQHDLPETHEVMRELRAVVDEYDDRMLVGETEDLAYHGAGEDELHMVFNFPLMRMKRLDPVWIRENQRTRLAGLPPGGWPCNTLNNHDTSRVYTHSGDGEHGADLARLALALVLTLKGTPFLYNGEEIGMTDLLLDDISRFKDLLGVWAYHMEIDVLGAAPEDAFQYAAQRGRDKCRTPMQWSRTPNAGFSPEGVETWLPVNPNYALGVNVADQLDDPDSLLSFYRRLLRFRKQTPALISGDYTQLAEDSAEVLAFLRSSPDQESDDVPWIAGRNSTKTLTGERHPRSQTCLVILNLSDQPQRLSFDLEFATAKVIFSSWERQGEVDDLKMVEIAPFEIYIAEVE
jgi:alpha-glucosidase